MKKTVYLLSLSVLLAPYSIAQKWKDLRNELIVGVGAANFLGDLGGANQIGTNFAKDLEWSLTKPEIHLGFRYKIQQWLAVKSSFTYTNISGDDKLTDELFRSYRNLSFRSPIVELAIQFEPAIVREKIGSEHSLRGVKGQTGLLLHVYPFVGLAVFYFNPKGQVPDTDSKGNPLDKAGQWVALRPLGTEGQELFASRKKYSLIQIAIPWGFGIKFGFNRRISAGLELGMRKTFTDYIDDVSTTYVDNEYILIQKGEIAAVMADRSTRTDPVKTDAGEQRGDPSDKDAYIIAAFSLNYRFNFGRVSKSRPKFFSRPINR